VNESLAGREERPASFKCRKLSLPHLPQIEHQRRHDPDTHDRNRHQEHVLRVVVDPPLDRTEIEQSRQRVDQRPDIIAELANTCRASSRPPKPNLTV
jgi:hypothetical protein